MPSLYNFIILPVLETGVNDRVYTSAPRLPHLSIQREQKWYTLLRLLFFALLGQHQHDLVGPYDEPSHIFSGQRRDFTLVYFFDHGIRVRSAGPNAFAIIYYFSFCAADQSELL